MSSLNLSIAPTIANIFSRFAHLVFVISIGTYFGISAETDRVFLIFAPIAVLMSITLSVSDVIIIPLIHRAEKLIRDDVIITKLLTYTLLFIPLSAIILFISSWVNGSESLSVLFYLLPIATLNAASSIISNILCAKNNVVFSLLGPFYGAVLALVLILLGLIEATEIGLCAALLVYEVGRFIGLLWKTKISLCFKAIGDAGSKLLNRAYSNAKIQFIGALLMAMNPMIDIYFASILNEGDSTSVEYVGRFWNMTYALFVGYLAVFYTGFSRQVTSKDILYKDVNKKAFKIGILAALVSVVGIAASPFIINIFYMLGGPGEDQKIILSHLLQLYLLGTGPYVAGMLYVRAFSALDKITVLTKVAAIFLVTNILLNYLLIKWFQVYGIAMATSFANMTCFIVFYYYFQKYFVNKQNLIVTKTN